MREALVNEIRPLLQNDCFSIFSSTKAAFDFSLHLHETFELNFIQNGKNLKRVIGDHIEDISAYELVLIGPNLQHTWYTHNCKSKEIKEITIQFHRDLFDEKFLQRNEMNLLKTMFENSLRGILFSSATISDIMPRLLALTQKQGFDSVLELMSILDVLSASKNQKILSNLSFSIKEKVLYNNSRVEKVMLYINNNFDSNTNLKNAAKIAAMTPESLSRFFKQRTGKTFVDTLTEVRLGNASRMLIDPTLSVCEIAYKCGFNNMSNFNRVFKKKMVCTPKEFRETYNSSGKTALV